MECRKECCRKECRRTVLIAPLCNSVISLAVECKAVTGCFLQALHIRSPEYSVANGIPALNSRIRKKVYVTQLIHYNAGCINLLLGYHFKRRLRTDYSTQKATKKKKTQAILHTSAELKTGRSTCTNNSSTKLRSLIRRGILC